jgi:hypothetical protein
MHPDAFERALRGFCRRQPFIAFYVELASGYMAHIEHPEALAVRGGAAVFVRKDGGYEVFDGHSVTRLFDESRETFGLE